MKLRVFQDTLIGGQWTGVGVGDFSEDVAGHLIKIGVAEPYEAKVVESFETKTVKKPDPLTSASLPAPASRKRTARKPRKKPIKS